VEFPSLPYPFVRKTVPSLLTIVAGAAVGVTAALLLGNVDLKWIILGIGGTLLLLPTLVVRNPRLFLLGILVCSLPFEISKNLFKETVDPHAIFEQLGMTPSKAISLAVYSTDLIFASLVMVWLFGVATKRFPLHVPKLAYLFAIWLAWISIWAVFAPYPLLSALELVRQYRYLIILVFLANVLDSRHTIRVLLGLLLLTLAFEAVVSLARYQLNSWDPLFGSTFGEFDLGMRKYELRAGVGVGDRLRSTGTFDHPSAASMYMELIIPVVIALWIATKSRGAKWLLFGLFVLAVAGVVVTYSRTGLVALLLGGGVTMLLCWYRGFLSRRVFGLAMAAGVLALVAASPPIYKYLNTRPDAFVYRFFLLDQGLEMIQAHPIRGVGLANSTAVKRQLASKRVYKADDVTSIHFHHIAIMAETGVVGYGLFLAFFLMVVVMAVRQSRTRDPDIAAVSLGIAGAYVTILVHMFGDNLAGNSHHVLLLIYAAMVVAMARLPSLESEVREHQADAGLGRPRAPAFGEGVSPVRLSS